MHALAVTGSPESDRQTLFDRLIDRLSERGRVGTVTRSQSEPETRNPAQTYELADNSWTATGDSLSLSTALDRLAQSCEYAVVDGFPDSRLPTVALGPAVSEDVFAHAHTLDGLDLDSLVERVEATDPYETLSSLVAEVTASPDEDRAGAVATFTGRVRAKDSPDDDPTEYLEFESYDGVAQEKMDAIRTALEARDGVYEVRLHHRTGVVEAGEDIVFVVVLAGHRTEAFRTVEDGIDRLKEEVPLFKKEVTVNDEFWAHEH